MRAVGLLASGVVVTVLTACKGGKPCDPCTIDTDCEPGEHYFCADFSGKRLCANELRATTCCTSLGEGTSRACQVLYGRPPPPPSPAWHCNENPGSASIDYCSCTHEASTSSSPDKCFWKYPCCYAVTLQADASTGNQQCKCGNHETTCGDIIAKTGAVRVAKCPP